MRPEQQWPSQPYGPPVPLADGQGGSTYYACPRGQGYYHSRSSPPSHVARAGYSGSTGPSPCARAIDSSPPLVLHSSCACPPTPMDSSSSSSSMTSYAFTPGGGGGGGGAYSMASSPAFSPGGISAYIMASSAFLSGAGSAYNHLVSPAFPLTAARHSSTVSQALPLAGPAHDGWPSHSREKGAANESPAPQRAFSPRPAARHRSSASRIRASRRETGI